MGLLRALSTKHRGGGATLTVTLTNWNLFSQGSPVNNPEASVRVALHGKHGLRECGSHLAPWSFCKVRIKQETKDVLNSVLVKIKGIISFLLKQSAAVETLVSLQWSVGFEMLTSSAKPGQFQSYKSWGPLRKCPLLGIQWTVHKYALNKLMNVHSFHFIQLWGENVIS